jgi:hypothetical protein
MQIQRVLCQRLLDRRVERARTCGDVGPDMNPEGPAVAHRQDLKVTARLRCLDETECALLPGDLQIQAVVAGHLKEHAAVTRCDCRRNGARPRRPGYP